MGKSRTKRDRRAPRRPGRGRVLDRARSNATVQWAVWGGLALAAVVLGLVISSRSAHGGTASDFSMVAYQGADILPGEELQLSRLFEDGKPVVVNFWAGLCPPCRAEMPGFQRAYDDLGEQFILVGVDIGPFVGLGSNGDAQRFLKEFEITYPAAYAVDAAPVRDYAVRDMPTTVFITPDRQVLDVWGGFLSEDRMRSKIADLLAASP